MKQHYSPFSKVCIRQPILPLSYLFEYLDTISTHPVSWLIPLENQIICNAIYVASPDFYDQLLLCKSGDLNSQEKIARIKITLLKYIARMSTRCTPFGLFAGCSIGDYGNETISIVNKMNTHTTQNRLDMDFIVKLAKKIEQEITVKNVIKWYPNTSLYSLGNTYRYIEYTYTDNKRVFSIEGLYKTEIIASVITFAKKGCTFIDLVAHITNKEISEEEASLFISQLIRNQLLVSELEPKLTQGGYLQQINRIVLRAQSSSNLAKLVKKLTMEMSALNTIKANWPQTIQRIQKNTKESNIEIRKKQLLQTDLFLNTQTKINTKWGRDINKVIALLSKVSKNENNPRIANFKTEFIKRYGDAIVPLTLALDTESGIDYLQQGTPVNSNFLEKIYSQNSKQKPRTSLPWNQVSDILHKKVKAAASANAHEIVLKSSDFKEIQSMSKLPPTISVFGELLCIDSDEQFFVNGITGHSAANLLARFGNGDSEINKLLHEITHFEKEHYKEKIVAEVVHLSNDRMGNIARRPPFRDYEIPYLAQASVSPKYQIRIDDLSISVRNNRIILYSESKAKEVVPYHTNAHNFRHNTTPIYQFLCEIGTQDYNKSMSFSWGALENIYSFLPRVTFENFILKKASWFLAKEDIQSLIKNENDDALLKIEMAIFQKNHNLPDLFQLVQGDNTLVVKITSIDSVKMFLQTVKNLTEFVLEEFLFSENAISKDTTGNAYCNQIILPFYCDSV